MRSTKMTFLAWGLLPMAALLCHCAVHLHTDPSHDDGEPDAAPSPVTGAGSEAPTALPVADSGAATDAPDATPVKTDGAPGSFAFQPSNIPLATIEAAAARAKDEVVASPCTISTDTVVPEQDCFDTNAILQVTQSDGSPLNVIVVHSLRVESKGVIRATGTAPLAIVSLTDVTLSGGIDGHSEDLSIGAGGASGSASGTKGLGPGGGLAGSDGQNIGGGGGSFCGRGGSGGNQTGTGRVYGDKTLRPLLGGSSGGSGEISGSGAGGGAIQLVAAGTLTMEAGSTITVGGEGGIYSGAQNQVAGGGGSGGAILIEAVTVKMGGFLAANGGGGGGNDASPKGEGSDATPDATPARGGAAAVGGAAGGSGSAAGVFEGGAGAAGSGDVNSGGGGGGPGWIRVNSLRGSTVTGGTSPTWGAVCAASGTVRTLGMGR